MAKSATDIHRRRDKSGSTKREARCLTDRSQLLRVELKVFYNVETRVNLGARKGAGRRVTAEIHRNCDATRK